MFRTFLWFFTVSLIFIVTIPIWILARLFPGKNKVKWPQFVLDVFLPIANRAAGFKVNITGQENFVDGPAVYAGNHQGLFDMVIAIGCMNGLKPFLAKKEAEKIPFIGSWMKMFDCVFIERGNTRASVAAVNKVEELLKSGKSVIIFPEGTRSRKHEMGKFKAGAFRPAIRAGVPVVPFVVDGTYKAWDEHHRITPTTASLTILPPIETKNLESERTVGFAEEVERRIKMQLG